MQTLEEWLSNNCTNFVTNKILIIRRFYIHYGLRKEGVIDRMPKSEQMYQSSRGLEARSRLVLTVR